MNLLSAKQAYVYPVEGVVSGTIPKWIEGSLYRVGPAKYEVGQYKYNHFFDGLGMIQKYWLHNGKVTFTSQYVQSDTYMKNMVANRIVVSEFGTVAIPDPCQSIFKKLTRFTDIFDSSFTDNTNVCVYPLGDELFTATETNVIHRINPQDLSTLGSIRLDKILSINRATAHQHIDIKTGLVHLLGFMNSPPAYVLVTIPPINKEESKDLKGKYDMEKLLTEAKITGKVNSRWKLNPSYFHSFGITENYYILLECPLSLSIIDLMKRKLRGDSFANSLKWWPEEKTIIHIINRKTGETIPNIFITDALFTFHHINSYEENDHIVIDYCGYDDGSIIPNLYKESLENEVWESKINSRARRLVVPLHVNPKEEENVNLIQLNDTTVTAKIIFKDNQNLTIYCSQEELAPETFIELPTINYSDYNGKKYRYIYGMFRDYLIKIDIIKKEVLKWTSEVSKSLVGEPVFIQDPKADGNKQEDEDLGILLVPVIYNSEETDNERYQSLIIINAKSMEEIARAEFNTVSIPLSFHGVFLNNEGK